MGDTEELGMTNCISYMFGAVKGAIILTLVLLSPLHKMKAEY